MDRLWRHGDTRNCPILRQVSTPMGRDVALRDRARANSSNRCVCEPSRRDRQRIDMGAFRGWRFTLPIRKSSTFLSLPRGCLAYPGLTKFYRLADLSLEVTLAAGAARLRWELESVPTPLDTGPSRHQRPLGCPLRCSASGGCICAQRVAGVTTAHILSDRANGRAGVIAEHPGLAFGVDGSRKLIGTADDALVGTIVKPIVGPDGANTATSCAPLARSRIDRIKDDEPDDQPRLSATRDAGPGRDRGSPQRRETPARHVPSASLATSPVKSRHDLAVDADGTSVRLTILVMGLLHWPGRAPSATSPSTATEARSWSCARVDIGPDQPTARGLATHTDLLRHSRRQRGLSTGDGGSWSVHW